jgi:hypothetical protein
MMVLTAMIWLAAGPVSLDLRRPSGDPNGISVASVVSGSEPLEWAGTRLAGGDINGDAIADLVIAAPGGTDDRPSRRGRLYVIFGGVAPMRPLLDLKLRRVPATEPGAAATFTSDADVVIEGAGDFDHLGRSLAVADLDADGLADIIAGAPRADGPADSRPDCGEVHVIYGAASLPRLIRLDQSAPPAAGAAAQGVRSAVISGRAAGDGFGSALQVGDVTADGAADLIIGAPLADATAGAQGALDAGEVVLIPAIGAALRERAAIDLADRALVLGRTIRSGAAAGDQAGSAVALGDFDGDSAADVAIGARGGDGPGNRRPDSGEVYFLFGGRPLAVSLALGLEAELFIAGPDIGDLAGGSLMFGDVDGDGRADLAIGAEFADGRANGRLDAGGILLLAGRSRQALESLRPPPGGPSATTKPPEQGVQPAPPAPVLIDLGAPALPGLRVIHGVDPGDHTGIRLLADLDGDGFAEILTGAEDASGRRNARAGAGEVRVIAGGGDLPATPQLEAQETAAIYGPVGGAHLGGAAAVDLDGDSRPELIVSAPQAGQSLAGRIFILRAGWKDLLHPAGSNR